MKDFKGKLIVFSATALLLAIPVWIWFVSPALTKLPVSFSYGADIVSTDNFYNEKTGAFSGEQQSVTRFSYDVVGQRQGVLLIKNVFDVRTQNGDPIFKVERTYGIDPTTEKHVAGFGDHDRDGYLFAPRDIRKSEPFTYWHINYDGPAHMTYVGEENIFGLKVYHYETHYEGVRIDQTKNLTNLPGVGISQGVELDPYLQIWIEPETGRMIKYIDQTVAYYYDLKTGARLNPWNKFSNTYTRASVLDQVNKVRNEKLRYIIIEYCIPCLVAVCALSLFLLRRRKWAALLMLFSGLLAVAAYALLRWYSLIG